MDGIDLHTHTTASDGSLAPAELVRAARDLGLAAVAVTDHDTVDGNAEALDAGAGLGVEVVPGCEISADHAGGPMHILGYYLPRRPARLPEVFAWLSQSRRARNLEILDKLKGLGADIPYEEVLARASGTVGRPHIAAILAERGLVPTAEQAFARFLGRRGQAYVPKAKLEPARVIAALKDEGATVVLAHPFLLGLDGPRLEPLLRGLKDQGLDGIEVFYSEHSPSQVDLYLHLAAKLDLLITGGSDFHGRPKPDITLGRGRGKLFVPRALLDRMKERRAAQGLPLAP